MHGHGRVVQCLAVGVAKHERDIVDALVIHVVDGVSATATHADDFDEAAFFLVLAKTKVDAGLRELLRFCVVSLVDGNCIGEV